jgi:hypothetical protein
MCFTSFKSEAADVLQAGPMISITNWTGLRKILHPMLFLTQLNQVATVDSRHGSAAGFECYPFKYLNG